MTPGRHARLELHWPGQISTNSAVRGWLYGVDWFIEPLSMRTLLGSDGPMRTPTSHKDSGAKVGGRFQEIAGLERDTTGEW